MKTNKSAILQMLNGERGNFDRIPRSDEYNKASNDLTEKVEEFKMQITNNPQLLEKFNALREASEKENAICANEIYREAFAFGLAIGQEVFGK